MAIFGGLGCLGDFSRLCGATSHGSSLITAVLDGPTEPNSSGLDVLHEAIVPLRVFALEFPYESDVPSIGHEFGILTLFGNLD